MIIKKFVAACVLGLAGASAIAGTAQAVWITHGKDTMAFNKLDMVPRDNECDGNGVFGNARTKSGVWTNGWDGNGCKSGGATYQAPYSDLWYKGRLCEHHKSCTKYYYP